MNYELAKRINDCPHDNGHENYGEGNICVECRAKSEDIKEAVEYISLIEKIESLEYELSRLKTCESCQRPATVHACHAHAMDG